MNAQPIGGGLRAPALHTAGGRAARVLGAMPAWSITALAGIADLIAAPPSADLAAASYRSELFGASGFALWDNGWYGGHHLPAYSVLTPALSWLISSRLLAVLSLTAATALFAALIDARFPARATRIAAAWFAVGAAIALLSCRVAFDLGLALGLAALLSAQRRSTWRALVLALLCPLASPVAGGFLALAALAWLLALRAGWPALRLGLAALAPIVLLALAFPEGGFQPFVPSAFYPALACVLAVAALIPGDGRAGTRALRAGALLYAAAMIGAYVLKTPAGGNVDRLGALVTGPVAACALAAGARARLRWPWRRRALLVLAPLLLYWQANAPVTDFASAAADPSVHASYYSPLLAELTRLGIGNGARPARIEVVPTADHWEARFIAPHVAIARGWERQLDNVRNALFYRGRLDAARLRAWLHDEAISYMALPDAPLDYSARAEARLLRHDRPPYLREVWRSTHWRLFAVLGAAPLAQPPAKLLALGTDSFTLLAPRAGSFTVRVRYTPYWRLAAGAGCVAHAPGDWTALRARHAGALRVVIAFSLERLWDHGPRCR